MAASRRPIHYLDPFIRGSYQSMTDLRQLRYFIAVAEELHFSAAARRLPGSQPALSQQIRLLERTLGVELLTRTTRKVELTPAGAVFLDGARRTVAEAERSVVMAQRVGHGDFDTLRVSFTDAAALSVLPGGVRIFRTKFPTAHLDLREEAGAAAQLDAVHRGLTDVAILRGPIAESGLTVQGLLNEPFQLVLPDQHPLARRTRVPLRLVREESWVLFPRRLSPSYYDLIVAMCHQAGFSPAVAYEVEKFQTVLSLVASGSAISIAPLSNASLSFAGVVYRPMTGTPATVQIAAAFAEREPSRVLTAFLDALRLAGRHAARGARLSGIDARKAQVKRG